MINELREYQAPLNKVDALHKRFREGTLELFEKHSIKVIGFWTRVDDPTILVYLCQFDDEHHQKTAWASFGSDPVWKELKTKSEVDGPITSSMTSYLLKPVAYFQREKEV